MLTIPDFMVPESLSDLIAVAALLLIWQYHQIQVRKGRILAIDVFDRTGIRFYVYLAVNDPDTCEVCRDATGRAFLPSDVARKHFKPLARACLKSPKCDGVLVGLYGAWAEARSSASSDRRRSARRIRARARRALRHRSSESFA